MTPDTLELKRTTLLAKAADLARQQHETDGAIAVLDELLAETRQDDEVAEIREGMSHELERRGSVVPDTEPLHFKFHPDGYFRSGADPHPSVIPNKLAEHMATFDTWLDTTRRDSPADLVAPDEGMSPPSPPEIREGMESVQHHLEAHPSPFARYPDHPLSGYRDAAPSIVPPAPHQMVPLVRVARGVCHDAETCAKVGCTWRPEAFTGTL